MADLSTCVFILFLESHGSHSPCILSLSFHSFVLWSQGSGSRRKYCVLTAGAERAQWPPCAGAGAHGGAQDNCG